MNRDILYKFFSFFFLSIGSLIIVVSSLYQLNKTHIGVAFALPPLIYFIMRKRIIKTVDTNKKVPLESTKRLFILLVILFLLCVSISLLFWGSETYRRPIGFFIMVAMAYVVIGGQIFLNSTKKNVPIVLLEIIIIAIIVRGSIYYLYPTVYGNDPFFHTEFVQVTLSTGSLPPKMGDYIHFPYTHLITAYVHELSGLDFKNSYFVISLIEVFASLFIFLIGRILGGIRLGLLSAMLVTLAPYNLFWGFWIIPMTLGLVFFIIIIYLLVKRNESFTIKISALLVLFCLSIIVVHTVASFVSWIIITITFIGLIVNNFIFSETPKRKLFMLSISSFLFSPLHYRKFRLSFTLVSLFGISLFSYWMFVHHYTGEDIFSLFTGSLITSLTRMDVDSVGAVSLAPTLKYSSIFLLDLPSTLLLLFSVLGSLFIINHNFSRVKLAFVTTVIVLVSIVYGGALVGNVAILPHRWFVFMEVLLVILAAYGVYMLIFTFKTIKKQFIISSLIVFMFAFSAITTPLNNTESAFYAQELGMRSGLYDSEVVAADFIQSNYNETVVRSSKFAYLKGEMLNPNETESYTNGLLVIREYDLEKGFNIPLFGHGGKLLELVFPNSTFFSYLDSPKCNKVYDNGEVESFLNK
jgi:hypothetical protein